jgi:hypothetical protein
VLAFESLGSSLFRDDGVCNAEQYRANVFTWNPIANDFSFKWVGLGIHLIEVHVANNPGMSFPRGQNT